MYRVPEAALPFGLNNSPVGTHGSRTVMLSELRLLLEACPPDAGYADYRSAVVEENVLGKRTVTTRKESVRRLRELYALSLDVLLFRVLRDLWSADPAAHPLLALLCAAARDPILRATAEPILAADPGDSVSPQVIAKAASEAFPGRYNPTMLANIGRHAASSWRQSGHLEGRFNKTRVRVESRPEAVAYALLLGRLCGAGGAGLFLTFWSRLLDAPEATLRDQAVTASRLGWIEYRSAGGVTEVGFGHLLGEKGVS
ncbi:MAG: hypothetical protein M3Q10_05565 [Chloroflexota bacterium]|nr:hypothetical protein [Chloroflexota bacterium]